MEQQALQGIPTGIMAIMGLVQFAIIIWIFIFPVLILKKLTEISDALKDKGQA